MFLRGFECEKRIAEVSSARAAGDVNAVAARLGDERREVRLAAVESLGKMGAAGVAAAAVMSTDAVALRRAAWGGASPPMMAHPRDGTDKDAWLDERLELMRRITALEEAVHSAQETRVERAKGEDN